MEIEKAENWKKSMEHNLYNYLTSFEIETGLIVESISVIRIQQMFSRDISSLNEIHLNVKLRDE